MNQKEVKKLIEEYPLLNKPCYIENLNGQKNLKEILQPQNLLIILWYIIMIGLFVMSV